MQESLIIGVTIFNSNYEHLITPYLKKALTKLIVQEGGKYLKYKKLYIVSKNKKQNI